MPQRVLITHAEGMLAFHTVERLAASPVDIIGTVNKLSDSLTSAYLPSREQAEIQMRLVENNPLDAAALEMLIADRDIVIHDANYFADAAEVGNNLVSDIADASVEATLCVLRSASASERVHRVVLVSSMAAMTGEPVSHVLAEDDWNTTSSRIENPAHYAITQAEKAAWQYMEHTKPDFDLIVINPAMIVGHSPTNSLTTSHTILMDLFLGKQAMQSQLTWGQVDVRDIADTLIAAMESEQACGRYLCAGDCLTQVDLMKLMCQHGYTDITPHPALAQQTPRFSNAKVRSQLGIRFRGVESGVAAMLENLASWGRIKAVAGHVPTTTETENRCLSA